MIFRTALLFLSAVYIIIFNQVTVAQNNYYDRVPNNLNSIASAITVLLKDQSSDGSESFPSGSGVIISRKSNSISREINNYYVLTVAHNLDSNRDDKVDAKDKIINDYQIKTQDDKYYYVTNYNILKTQELGNLDLAVLNFSSDKDYQTAKFKNEQGRLFVNSIQPEEDIYVAGFPENSEGFTIDKGKLKEQHQPSPDDNILPFTGGYSLRYKPSNSNRMAPGMSGGPIFTSNGYLIGAIQIILENGIASPIFRAAG
jgi:S1-C subfamily serine protease